MTSKKYLWFTNFLLVAVLVFGLIPVDRASSAYVSAVSPNEITNDKAQDIEINGGEFKASSEVYLGTVKLQDLTVQTYNKMIGTVPKGLDAGIYDLKIVSKDAPIAIVPNAVKITGNAQDPRVLGVKRDQIPGGIKYSVKMNVPFTAKLLAGADRENLKVVSSKQEFSSLHTLPYEIPTNDTVYITQIAVTPEGGQEIRLDKEEVEMRRSGAYIPAPKFEVLDPVFEFLPDSKKMEVKIATTWPVAVEVSKSFFADEGFQVVQSFGTTYSTNNQMTIRELTPDTMYYLKIAGKTEGEEFEEDGEKNEDYYSFENTYQVYFTDMGFEGGIESSIWEEEESGVVAPTNEETTESPVDPFYEGFNQENNWGVYYVDALKKQEIVKGGKDGKFDPMRLLTRAELALMIARISKYELPDNPPAYFTDVPKTHDVFKTLGFMVPKKVVKGFGDGTFRPDEPVSRGDVLIMIINALELKIDENLKTSHFTDVKLGDLHLPYIELAYSKGWLTKGNKEYRIHDNLLRVEAAKLFALAYDLVDSVEVDEAENEEIELVEGSSSESTATSGVTAPSGISEDSGTTSTSPVSTGNGETQTSVEGEADEEGLDQDLADLLENLL